MSRELLRADLPNAAPGAAPGLTIFALPVNSLKRCRFFAAIPQQSRSK
jgi:hypothetical protein